MKYKQVKLTDEEMIDTITRLEELVPVHSYGASLQDFTNNITSMPTKKLVELTRLLRKLYKHADVAFEPYARQCDRQDIEG